MRDVASRHGVSLRPHVKTHKCVEIARLQHGGTVGQVTVSTLAEAEGFAAAGFRDLTYAVPIEPGKFRRVLDLARTATLQLVTDETRVARALGRAAAQAGVRPQVLMEIDCGDHRCGIDPASDQAIALAREIAGDPALDFRGILTHAGHSYAARGSEAVREIAVEEARAAADLAARIRSNGVPVPVVSVGSTPTMAHVGRLDGVTEIRPGNYVFFDGFMEARGNCRREDIALTVLAAVVHRDASRLVLDAGAIALSKDLGAQDPDAGYGRLLDLDGRELGLRIARVSQEHGEVDLPHGLTPDTLSVGARVRILPNHACLTAAQHDGYFVLERDGVAARWNTIRGW